MRVLAAMSGGVDSSVAAAAMLEQGHEVVGVTLKQWVGPGGVLPVAGCCTAGDAEDARRVAAQLGIRYYVLDQTAEFETVVESFAAEYAVGRTPNPCIECNRRVRFGALLGRLERLGCDVLVTGHHARIDWSGDRPRLLRGRDGAKDQSYVLHMLSSSDLERVRFPIGEMTKDAVRAEARRLGLRTASKPDSQDLCFVAGDYRAFLGTGPPGVIVDADGTVLGRHDGVAGFTVGQRRGLGVAVGEPRYVTSIEAESGTVTIGPREDLRSSGCTLQGVSFVGPVPPSAIRASVKLRYRSDAVPAHLYPGERWEVRFVRPQEAVSPGQAAVFYDGDEVLGGGTIAEVAA